MTRKRALEMTRKRALEMSGRIPRFAATALPLVLAGTVLGVIPSASAATPVQTLGVTDLVGWFAQHPEDIPESYRHEGAEKLTQVVDYVAGMTDRYAISLFQELFVPRAWNG